jgi:hypothetical protein
MKNQDSNYLFISYQYSYFPQCFFQILVIIPKEFSNDHIIKKIKSTNSLENHHLAILEILC